jgi:hypothetical protein
MHSGYAKTCFDYEIPAEVFMGNRVFQIYHSQFQDLLDFFLHAAPSMSQILCHQEAKLP